MMSLALVALLLSVVGPAICSSNSSSTVPGASHNILPSNFKPPQVFKNINLVHVINLEKSYTKESINVVIENVASTPQDEYFIPVTAEQMKKIGGLEVRDRKVPELGLFDVEAADLDMESDTQFFRVRLPTPLSPKSQQTLGITYTLLSSLYPMPANIEQDGSQFLVHDFSAIWPSSYVSLKQKTEVKFPNNNVPDYTILPRSGSIPESPQKQGTKFSYGTFGELPAGALEPVRVRYEFTKPLIHISELERDIEVSHWGGNVAFEERYQLHNLAANLSGQFSRVLWARDQYYNPATTAIKELRFPLKVGSLTPYFTDVIGNVSTSRFRSNKREANLELKPRYPVFGGWHYPFTVGWAADLKSYLRKLSSSETYILNVPFLEGPKQQEGVTYTNVTLRVILPEGARNVKYETSVPITASSISMHKTFMDTLGRTTLTLTAQNLVDDIRDRELIVTYEYPFMAGLRKPAVIAVSVYMLFVAAWAIGKLDVGIHGKMFLKS